MGEEPRTSTGAFRDQFFSTVFPGGGLLFLTMISAAAASAGAIAASYGKDPSAFASSATCRNARRIVAQILTVYAPRTAAVFPVSQATLWLRTRLMPTWMAIPTTGSR